MKIFDPMISLYVKYKDSKAEKTTFFLALKEGDRMIKIALPFREAAQDYDWRRKEFVGSPTARFSNETLLRWRAVAATQIRHGQLDGLDVEQVAANIRRELGLKETAGAEKGGSVLAFYRRWLLEGTARKAKSNRGNLHHCRVFEEYLVSIHRTDLPFEEVTYGFYEDFVSFLRGVKNYKENTVGVHVKDLKAVMNEAYRRKLHSNTDYRMFYKPQTEVDRVFFTEEEIRRMYGLSLPPMQEKVRDIIVLGCYVAQRHGDYSVITKDDIKEDGYIHITQRKGGNRIVIPVHPVVREILDKYGGYPPVLSQQVVNREIKKIAREAGITEKIQVTEIKGGEKSVRYREKWEMVSTHTARRSGITNALLAGVPRQECMYLSGHRSESAFNRYVCITRRQYADRLAGMEFFGGQGMDEERILSYVRAVLRRGESPEWLRMLTEEMKDSVNP